jgi:membrane dipeptidase
MVDVSHPSKTSMMQALALSKAPVIASHSAVRALCNHSRNLDDDQLIGLRQNGGVVQVVAFSSYVKCGNESPERLQALTALRQRYGLGPQGRGFQGLPDSVRTAFQQDMLALNRQFPPPPRATVRDFVDHIDYVVRLIGIEHVGISSDFDGGGGVEGWSNAEETFNVTLELVRRGYSEEQIAQIWGGNLLRVMEENEKISRSLRAGS